MKQVGTKASLAPELPNLDRQGDTAVPVAWIHGTVKARVRTQERHRGERNHRADVCTEQSAWCPGAPIAVPTSASGERHLT